MKPVIHDPKIESVKMPITAHLLELRQRLIKIIRIFLLLFLCMLPFSNNLYEWLSYPLRMKLPQHATMIATEVTATFLAPLKLSFSLSIFILMPYILYHILQFIAPALYKNEKKIAYLVFISSIILFYLGVAFAYFLTLPAALTFFIHFAPDTVVPMTDINSYLDFCLKLFLVFGLTFEIPILTLLFILAGIVSVNDLIAKRRFIIVGCFFISMFITPPDALSMLMLAIPMCLLFELGLFIAKYAIKTKTHVT